MELLFGDCLEVMNNWIKSGEREKFDLIWTDPPYFLSNGGISCKSGKAVSVDKGDWDKTLGHEGNFEFTKKWLSLCQILMKKDATIWVSGTHHVIHYIAFAMQELGFKILNEIIWEKPNPPPNLSCRYFTHATETIIWAAKDKNSKHYFNYDLMKSLNDNKQMKNIWRILPPSNKEKIFGKHVTQKPVALVERCLLASSKEGDKIFDPFMGSGTTGVASKNLKRHFCGIEKEKEYFDLANKRINNTVQALL